MNQKKYTNETLAKDFYRASTPYCDSPKTYKTMTTRIANSSIDIADFFQKHGNLDDLKVSGIGEVTKKFLEAILAEGVEVVIQRTIDDRINGMQTYFYDPRKHRNYIENHNNDEHNIKVSGKLVVKKGKIIDS